MKCLEKLILSGCSSLGRFPEIDGKMEQLLELHLDGTRIDNLPSSIGYLTNLVLLNLKDCRNLVSVPNSIHALKCLKALNLSGCSKVENLPDELQELELLEKLDLSGTAIRKPQSFIFQFKNLKVLSFKGCKGSPSKVQSYWNPLSMLFQGGSTNSMALTLPPMSGLTSLTELNLSECNIGEGAIPSDIDRLSSLEFLDLSGNNFINLPATLAQLSNLIVLRLSNCKDLKSLPGLLACSGDVSIDGCDSLEVVANPIKGCNSVELAFINGTNCYRLAANNNALTLLKEHLKVYGNTRPYFNIIMPGSEIPESFNTRGDGSSAKIPLLPNIWNDSQWMGIALCCVLGSGSGNDAWKNHESILITPFIHGRGKYSRALLGYYFHSDFSRSRIMKDHVWLMYWSRDDILYSSSSLEEECDEAENLLSTEECDEIEFVFKPVRHGDVRPKVKNYGVRIVYEKDLEQVLTEEHSSIPNLNDIHQDTGGPMMNIFEEEEEEEAGSSDSDQDKPPDPKRLEKCSKLDLRWNAYRTKR